MALRAFGLLSIVLGALVTGVFWGPWLALHRSSDLLEPETFLTLTRTMSRNLGTVMTVLFPVTLLSIGIELLFAFRHGKTSFWLCLAGLLLYLLTLGVTVGVEVPIVKQIETWTMATIPGNWHQMRNRWRRFHLIRVFGSIVGLSLIAAAALV